MQFFDLLTARISPELNKVIYYGYKDIPEFNKVNFLIGGRKLKVAVIHSLCVGV